MISSDSAIYLPLIGGVLIGTSSCIMLFFLGRVTGISGIFASSFLARFDSKELWRLTFILGLLFGGALLKLTSPQLFEYSLDFPIWQLALAGLLVGFGTRLGSGCTSGHGVCGLPRKSLRSFVATICFMGFGVLTVFFKGLF